MTARPVIYNGAEFPSIQKVADTTNIPCATVRYGIIHKGTLKGLPIRYKFPIGPIGKLTVHLTEEHSSWVVQNLPENSTPSEFIAAILNDVIAEETA